MCKNFTRLKIQSKLAQKLLSLLASLSLMAGMVPLGGRSFVAEADVPDSVAIPHKLFATVDNLKDPEIFSLAEENDDKVGRVVFGTRPNPVKYYYEDWNTGTEHEEPEGPMTWLIAGWDAAQKSNKPGLVLYSEKPMISAKALDSNSDSRFQVDTSYKNYTPENDSGYPNTNPIEVYSNHWGASNIREQLDALFTGDGWFTGGEKARMLSSRITTTDIKNSVDYTTEDTLYVLRLKAADYNYPNNTSVTAGEADDLVIDKAYWGSRSWLRSPSPDDHDYALLALPGTFVDYYGVFDFDPALAAACKINLESDICESVIFASAASAANLAAFGGAAKISQIDINAPMYLRLDGSSQSMGTAMFNEDKSAVTAHGVQDSTLVIQGVTGSGANWCYSKKIDSNSETVTVDDVSNANAGAVSDLALTSFENCKVWLEKPVEDGGTLIYAVMATDFEETPGDAPTNPDGSPTPDASTNQHPDWGEREVHGGITHYVNAEGMTSVEISAENTDANGIVWLREESEGTAAWYGIDNSANTFASGSRFYVQWLNTAEHPEAFADIDEETRQQVEGNRGWLFRIGVIAPDGTRYSTLSNPVNVYVQIGDDWDKGDLQGFYIQQGTDKNVEVTYVEGWPYPEGTDEFGVMKLNHFSPYFIYDKDTEKEQSTLNSAKTGDELTYVTISGLGLVMTLALGLMLNSKISRKKSDE